MILLSTSPQSTSLLSYIYNICIIITIFISVTNSFEYRSYNGENNNILNPQQGSANQPFIRLSKPVSFNVKGVPNNSNPSPRVISNIVFDQNTSISSKENYTEMFNIWGKFLLNELILVENDNLNYPILVPKCDKSFDSTCKGNKVINYKRSDYIQVSCDKGLTVMDESDDQCYEQINSISSYIDGKSIYGYNEEIVNSLRTLEGGEMKMTQTNGLGELPSKNIDGVPVDNDANLFPTDQLFSLGDRKGNQIPGLLAIHTILLREHNRIARNFANLYSYWDDETIFQHSRSCIIQQIQKITYEEFIPLLLGHSFPIYNGYKEDINTQISNEFSSIAFKFINSQFGSNIEYYNENNTRQQPLPLKFSFYNPHAMNQGIEPIIRGLVLTIAENVDTFYSADLRNSLHGKPGQGGSDLASLDLQRSRDHGIPSYNSLRKQLGLKVALNFSDITNNKDVQDRLKQVYKSIDDVEAIVGGLAEDHMNGAAVGQLFYSIINEQFYRTRAGDRFWYELPNIKLINRECNSTSLSNLIKRSTLNIKNISSNVFKK